MNLNLKMFSSSFAGFVVLAIAVGLGSVPPRPRELKRSDIRMDPVPHIVHSENRIDQPQLPGDGRFWTLGIELGRELYTEENLERLFRFYSKQHPNKQDPMTISVVTDSTYAANGEKIAAGLETQQDASFDRGYIHTVIGGEFNEWFRYKPNLDDQNGWATVVLSGTRTFAKRNVLEKWNAAGNGMRFKVVAYELLDPDIKPKGVYYSFEIAEGGLIMSVRLDKQEAIPRDQVRILNDRVAYMFMGWKFAATADGGHNWSVWNAERDLPDWQCCDEALIKEVNISPDGVGKMSLSAGGELNQPAILLTDDYGLHWYRSTR